jgi:hypothetical protein
MTKEKSSLSIHKLSIGLKLSVDEVEDALSTASQEAMKARAMKAEEFELARIDIMKDETVVFFRGDTIIVDRLKKILKKKSRRAKFKVAKTTASALEKAP